MLRLLEIDELAKRKKLLVAQSDIHRQTMRLHVAVAQESIANLKKRFTVLGVSSAAVGLGASLVGMLFKKRPDGEPPGILSRIISGVSFFNQIKSFLARFKSSPDKPA